MNAPTELNILVSRQQTLQTVVNMRSNTDERVSAQNHSRSAHTEVLLVTETQLSHFLLCAQTGLPATTTQTTQQY